MPSHFHSERLSAKPADPSLPTLEGLQDELAATPSPLSSRELVELTDHLDAFAGKLASSPEPLPFLDLPVRFKIAGIVQDKVSITLWPPGLYIPGDADYKQYWFFPPPQGKNRYTREWVSGNGSAANRAKFATGELFAYTAARPTDPKLRSEAGIGFVFKPSATLAVYTIDVSANLIGQHRYDVNTTLPAGGSLREWGGLYTAAWEINPVDGNLTLHAPFGVVTLFDDTFLNLTGTPIYQSPLNGTIKTNIMLEGSRSYLIGVIAAVEIDNRWTMSNGQPMQPLPEGHLWKAWCHILGTILQVWIDPTIIYIP